MKNPMKSGFYRWLARLCAVRPGFAARLIVALTLLVTVSDLSLAQTNSRGIASNLPTAALASYTIQVNASPTHAMARAASKDQPAIELVNGKPVMSLTHELSARVIDAPRGTLILISAPAGTRAVGFTVSAPGILEPPPGIYHMPNNVVGMLRAVNPGIVTISVLGFPRRADLPAIFNGAGSNNWAGYSISGGPFLSIAGEWTVPTVYGDAGDHSATWIGIDGLGAGNSTLIQTGTSQDYSSGFLGTGLGGGPQYYAWWENFPDGPVTFPNPVSPGDHMVAIISLDGDPHPGSAMTWLIFLMDQTKNWTATQTVTYSGTLSTAEWIVERPMECFLWWCSYSDLADFTPVSFDVFDLVNSTSPNLATANAITMLSDASALATPSDPDGDKDGFTVAFGSQKPFQPGPWITTTTIPDAYTNQPYQSELSAVGAASFAWSAINLPPWLSLDQNTGVLTGTPPAAGDFGFTALARDASNQRASSQLVAMNLHVSDTPPPPDFSISADPVVVQLNSGVGGCTGRTAITVHSLFGFTDYVHLTASGAGVTSSEFSPSSARTTAQLTLHSSLCHGTLDEHLVSVTGTAGALTHTIGLDLVPQVITGNCNAGAGHPLRLCPPVP
jgi:hypothetical protein